MESDYVEHSDSKLSTESDAPVKRKLMRRMRIQARLEAAVRAKAIADGTYCEPEPEKPLMQEVIETSQDTLSRLYQEGKEQVTNVIVASDAKEVERREKETNEKNERLEKLKEESAEAMRKLDLISDRWNAIVETSGPLELHEKMNEQKANCLKLIEQKNELIKNFQMELKLADEKFMKDRKEMYEELSLITKRIDEQVLIMKKAYRVEMENIEDAIDRTRAEILEQHQKKWQALYNKREKDEVKNMERKFNLVEDFYDQLYQIHVDHEENYRQMKIQLETDVQELELELEQVKALCLLNSEKLDYNYQILKKREEENLYIKNHQKRRLNKLQDMMNMLRRKINEKKEATDVEFKKLTKEVHRLYGNILDTEKKGDRFMVANEDKFQNIWEMNDEEAKGLLNKILAADRVIHEQILGQDWIPPSVTVIRKKDIPSYRTAEVFVKEQKALERMKSREKITEPTSIEEFRAQKRALHRTSRAITSQIGFLVEERLGKLLEPYSEDEKTFVRLDNMCVALGVVSNRDVRQLLDSFMPYSVCLLCSGKKSLESLEVNEETQGHKSGGTSVLQLGELEEKVSKLRIQAKSVEHTIKHQSGSVPGSHTISLISRGPGSGRKTRDDQRISRPTDPKSDVCDYKHPFVVEKHNVLRAFKDFLSKYRADRIKTLSGIEQKLQKKRYTISRLLSFDEINAYWNRYEELLPQKLDTTWDGIYEALKRYLVVLKDRHELNMEAQALRRQNRELKRLLSLYKTPQNYQKLTLPAVPSVPGEPIDFLEIMTISQKLAI